GAWRLPHLAGGADWGFARTRAFEPRRVFAAVQGYRVTTMFLAPTMVHVLTSSGVHREYDLSSLHTIFYGGGPMYVEQQQEAVRPFGPIFFQIFAPGEAPLVGTTLPHAQHLPRDDPVSQRRRAPPP